MCLGETPDWWHYPERRHAGCRRRIVPLEMEESMTRAVFCVAAALLFAGCSGQSLLEDRSDQVQIKHRIPSK
jgi:hypothetical protein